MEKNGKHTKISGYLEKKGKHKMSSYKKYWFVLEGGLLLYYRSKDDYESISPCKGSINLGPPCTIKPCPSLVGVFQIQTRTATITLRAENLEEQNRWMEALMAEIQPNKITQKMIHFRYSIENTSSKEENQNTTPESESPQNSQEDIIHRLQKMGAQSYGNPIDTIGNRADFKKALPNFTTYEDHVRRNKVSEHIYERISTELADSSYRNKDNEVDNYTISPLQGFNTLKLKTQENSPKTFLLENDIYAISIQEKDTKKDDTNYRSMFSTKSKSSDKEKKSKQIFPTRNKSFIVGNDTYASIEKNTFKKSIDLNENDLSKKDIEENAYSIPYINDDKKNDVVYEYIDKDNVEYSEPCEYRLTDKNKRKKKEKLKEGTDKRSAKIKKRSSFINLVWKKKDKHKDKIEDIKDNDKECIYETVPEQVVEKVCFTDSSTVQMLSELQNILENKMPTLMEIISIDINSPTKKTSADFVPEPIKEIPEDEDTNNSENALEPPPLAPKTRKQEFSSPFHDVPTNNKPIPLPPRKKKMDNIKNLDDILDELNSQQIETKKNKVKKLIKKFSDPDFCENDVILRNNKRDSIIREEGDSDELNRLLAELVKVTNAPMLLPGVTSSLNGNNIKDEELSKLLPVKQRRYSEPDYDIPRPHKALTITQKRDDVSKNVIESTRFFGPILKPSGVVVPKETDILETTSQLNSITPDSLETNINQNPSTIKQENFSYDHSYKFIDKKVLDNHFPKSWKKSTDDFLIENDIYSEPRSIYNFQQSNEKNEDYVQDDEVFVDSLEVCKNEVSTEF